MCRRARLARSLLLALLGCTEPSLLPPTGEAFSPPAAYATWWQATEGCSGRTGRFARLAWVRVPSDAQGLFTWDGKRVAGLWHAPHTIYLSDKLLDHEPLVRHEMLHDLLQRGSHPDTPFVSPCNLRWPVLLPLDSTP